MPILDNAGTPNTDTSTPPPAATTPPPAASADPGAPPPTKQWFDSLAEDLRGDATIKNYKTMDDFARAHISLRAKFGADKIVIPGKNATDDDWKQTFQKLGLPETIDKYDLGIPKDAKVNHEAISKFAEAAHKANILPKQAKAVLDFYTGIETEQQIKAAIDKKALMETNTATLQNEWGQKFDHNKMLAQSAVNTYGNEKVDKIIAEKGLSHDPEFVKFLAKVGGQLQEDKIPGGANGTGGPNTPEELQAQYRSILGDTNHPYNNEGHAGHRNAVKEVEKIFQRLHPEQS